MQFFIKDNYYFDIDLQNQLRITGPENHLFLGLTFPTTIPLEINDFGLEKGNLIVHLKIRTPELQIPIPIVTDIRTLRSHTEQVSPRPTYVELIQQDIKEVMPQSIRSYTKNGRTFFEFSNTFIDDNGTKKKYGSIISFGSEYTGELAGKIIHIRGRSPIVITIQTLTNIRVTQQLKKKVFSSSYLLPPELFSPQLLKMYDQSQKYIEHLIRSKKTSSFEYGTIFPRDWIESADLGLGDLSQETVDYMYGQSLNHLSDTGEAWHENAIGEYKTKVKDATHHIDRKMIDIEPRYILGIKQVSKTFLTNQENQHRLRLVASYILKNAEEQELISFKKLDNAETEEYHKVGNWRDSYYAYPRQKSPLSPYDVNCVFYPLSLRVIREFYQFFRITDVQKLNQLIEKWDKQKDKFRLYHSGNLIGYSLALHGKKHLPLPSAHLDESYDLFYGTPSLEEIASFAEKIMDPNFFYTPVGPLLVDIDDDEFTTWHYHGKVIWPKQAAYAVAGLAKQFKRGLKEGWPWPVIETIKLAVITTSEACFKGWTDMGGIVPELYYYDEEQKRARLYTDQEKFEGQMSLIQLWSSVGARRIMQEYASVNKIAEAV